MKIIISKEAYAKVYHWIRKADFEVSGFGRVLRIRNDDGTDTFKVISAHLLKQSGGAAHTDIDEEALAKLMYTSRDEEGELKWWWHSHVNMPVFWSSTDTGTIESMGVNGWILATVFNKRNESRSALCYRTESEFGYNHELVDQVDFTVEPDETHDTTAWDAEFNANVVREVPTITRTHADEWRYNPRAGVVHQPSLLEHGDTVGLVSDSAMEEARALGIKYNKYKKILLEDDDKQIDVLTTKLLAHGQYNWRS